MVLGLLPAFVVACSVWTLVVDVGTLIYGGWNAALRRFVPQVFFLSMLPLGVIIAARGC